MAVVLGEEILSLASSCVVDPVVKIMLFGRLRVAAKFAFSLLLTGVAGRSFGVGVVGGESAFFRATGLDDSETDLSFSLEDGLPVPERPLVLTDLVWQVVPLDRLPLLGWLTAADVFRLVSCRGFFAAAVVVDTFRVGVFLLPLVLVVVELFF